MIGEVQGTYLIVPSRVTCKQREGERSKWRWMIGEVQGTYLVVSSRVTCKQREGERSKWRWVIVEVQGMHLGVYANQQPPLSIEHAYNMIV